MVQTRRVGSEHPVAGTAVHGGYPENALFPMKSNLNEKLHLLHRWKNGIPKQISRDDLSRTATPCRFSHFLHCRAVISIFQFSSWFRISTSQPSSVFSGPLAQGIPAAFVISGGFPTHRRYSRGPQWDGNPHFGRSRENWGVFAEFHFRLSSRHIGSVLSPRCPTVVSGR